MLELFEISLRPNRLAQIAHTTPSMVAMIVGLLTASLEVALVAGPTLADRLPPGPYLIEVAKSIAALWVFLAAVPLLGVAAFGRLASTPARSTTETRVILLSPLAALGPVLVWTLLGLAAFYVPVLSWASSCTWGVLIAGFWAGALAYGIARAPDLAKSRCARCGYDFRGLEGGRCPECGPQRSDQS